MDLRDIAEEMKAELHAESVLFLRRVRDRITDQADERVESWNVDLGYLAAVYATVEVCECLLDDSIEGGSLADRRRHLRTQFLLGNPRQR